MEALAGLPNVVATIVPHAKLAVHEEFPDQVAATIQNFLLGAWSIARSKEPLARFEQH